MGLHRGYTYWRESRWPSTGRSWTTDAGPRSSRTLPRPPGAGCGCSRRGWRRRPRSRGYSTSRGSRWGGARCPRPRSGRKPWCARRVASTASRSPPRSPCEQRHGRRDAPTGRHSTSRWRQTIPSRAQRLMTIARWPPHRPHRNRATFISPHYTAQWVGVLLTQCEQV